MKKYAVYNSDLASHDDRNQVVAGPESGYSLVYIASQVDARIAELERERDASSSWLEFSRAHERIAELEKALRHIEQTSLNDNSAAEKLTDIHDTAEKVLGL